MKANIPDELVAVLRDKDARRTLRDLLISGRNGRVRVGAKAYRLHIDEGSAARAGGVRSRVPQVGAATTGGALSVVAGPVIVASTAAPRAAATVPADRPVRG